MGEQFPILKENTGGSWDKECFCHSSLDQLEDLGIDVKENCRILRPRQYSAIPQIEN